MLPFKKSIRLKNKITRIKKSIILNKNQVVPIVKYVLTSSL